MSKKIICILIIVLLIGTVMPVVGTSINVKNVNKSVKQEYKKSILDEIDQQQ